MSASGFWAVVATLGLGTFLIRFSFLGLLGPRQTPFWLDRFLRFVPVSVLPAIAAPLVMWPVATGGSPDLARLLAALAALAVGVWRRSALAAIGAGMLTLGVALLLCQ